MVFQAVKDNIYFLSYSSLRNTEFLHYPFNIRSLMLQIFIMNHFCPLTWRLARSKNLKNRHLLYKSLCDWFILNKEGTFLCCLEHLFCWWKDKYCNQHFRLMIFPNKTFICISNELESETALSLIWLQVQWLGQEQSEVKNSGGGVKKALLEFFWMLWIC